MELADQLVPALILFASNLMSGRHGSRRYEVVTAVFGWTTLITLLAYLIVNAAWPRGPIKPYLFQVFAFSMLTALSRDYEKILRRFFPWNR
ncbi:MAG: hypothetical protein NVS9B15_17750 [Acidobacteriaceae bacterium]